MPMVVPCQRESWRAGMAPLDPVVKELTGQLEIGEEGNKKPAIEVEIRGVKYDYAHFKSLARVFTNTPSWHTEKSNYQYAEQTKDFFKGAENARNIFVSKQDTVLSIQIFASYYNAVKSQLDKKEFITTEGNPLQTLANLIPDTEAGDKLSMELFNCSAKDLHQQPNREAQMPSLGEEVPDHQERFKTEVKPTYAQTRKAEMATEKPEPGYMKPTISSQLKRVEEPTTLASQKFKDFKAKYTCYKEAKKQEENQEENATPTRRGFP